MKKQIINSKFYFLSFIALLVFGSCQKEKTDPFDETVESYVGTYLVNENCDGYTDAYSIQISRANSSSGLKIRNLYNTGAEITASVGINDGQLNIYGGRTVLQENNDYKATLQDGFGGIDGDRLTISFQVKILDKEFGESATFSCTVVGNK